MFAAVIGEVDGRWLISPDLMERVRRRRRVGGTPGSDSLWAELSRPFRAPRYRFAALTEAVYRCAGIQPGPR
jgi:hypothetical protein